MLWVILGLVVGLVVSSFMIFAWFYRLKRSMAEKGFGWTSRFWVLTWVAMFFGSVIGLMREFKAAQGNVIDGVMLYASAIMYWIALLALITGLIFDAVRKTRRM